MINGIGESYKWSVSNENFQIQVLYVKESKKLICLEECGKWETVSEGEGEETFFYK